MPNDGFLDRRGRAFTCVCNCLLLFEARHPLLERALNLSHATLKWYVAHKTFNNVRHYGMMTRVLCQAAGGEFGEGPGRAPTKMVNTFEQMSTYNSSCQDPGLRLLWLAPAADPSARDHIARIISSCYVFHSGWRGVDDTHVSGATWAGSIGQRIRQMMTSLSAAAGAHEATRRAAGLRRRKKR